MQMKQKTKLNKKQTFQQKTMVAKIILSVK